MENLNEAFFMVTMYHLVLFSGLIWDPELLHIIGISMISSVGLILLTGTIVILYINIKMIIRKLKLRKMKKTREAILKKRNIEL